jgi:outer membrane protein TolC
MNRLVIVIAASVSAASCVLGPNYRRPAVAVAAAFRDTTATTAQAESRSLTDLSWFDLFKDDTLAGYHKTREQRAQQEQLVAALRDATRLSTDRYQGGLDSYLQVLDAQRNLFRSELDLTTLQRQELSSIVELYRALGGGWNQ